MGRQKIVYKDIEFGQLIDYAGHRSRSSAGEGWARNHTLHRPSRNDSFVFKSILELTQSRTGATQVMGSDFAKLSLLRVAPDRPPDHLLRNSAALDKSVAGDTTED